MGNTGWSYDDVLPFFKKMESYQGNTSELRGVEGPLIVTDVTDRYPIYNGFFFAAVGFLGFSALILIIQFNGCL